MTMTIEHTLPDRFTVTFEVTLRDTSREDDTVSATIEYPAGVDLSDYTVGESYPMAAVEAAVSGLVGHAVHFVDCTFYGTEGDSTVEVWAFDAV